MDGEISPRVNRVQHPDPFVLQMPTVSVVIPTFNRSAMLCQAVESVLNQTSVAPEVIVVDDGSTDGTRFALQAFGSKVRIIVQYHAGVSAARNRGIRASKGEWLAFLDSDDLWLPGKLSEQLDYLAKHPEIKICQTEEVWLRNGERLNPKKYHRKPQGFCFPLLLERCLISPSAVVIHRSVFDEVGLFDESLPACEDYDLWLRIGLRCAVGLVDKPLTIKRGGHPDQLSACIPSLDRFRIQALANLLVRESMDPEKKKLVLKALRRKSHIYSAGCRKRGKFDEAESMQRLVEEVSGGGTCQTIHESSPEGDLKNDPPMCVKVGSGR